MKELPKVAIDSAFIPFKGGLDTDSPPLLLPDGFVRRSLNYECDVVAGYAMSSGYERFDGRASPSAATYSMIGVTGSRIVVGDTVTGVTSAATGKVIALDSTPYGNLSEGQIVVTQVTGTFVSGEVLNVLGAPQGTTTSVARLNAASTPYLNAIYKNLAADIYRALIGQPTGAGSILGVVQLAGIKYCFRNNAGNTEAGLWKSTSSGWSAVALGRELSFTSGGTTVIAEGNTITGAVSGATAVITRVVLESGSWAAGTAAGRLIFASQTGTFQAETLNIGASIDVATIAGNSSPITLLPGGKYKFYVHNFGGGITTKRIYGCDGVNRGFEFDGTVFVPISTGMTTDTPKNVFVHAEQLFFSFGASVQHSGPTTPYAWSPILGAGEIAVGDTVSGFMSLTGTTDSGALLIVTRNRLFMLYGNNSSDWNLVKGREDAGGFEHTIQQIGATFMLDDRGLTTQQTTDKFGNFADAAISSRIKKWIDDRLTLSVASCIVRAKNQYRLFFSDKYVLSVTVSNGKVVGLMPLKLSHTATCAWSSENASGVEEIFIGATDGYVYQLDKGTSHDGSAIERFLDLHYASLKSPRINKRMRCATFEATGEGYSEFSFSYRLGYGRTAISQPGVESETIDFATSNWDEFSWDSFFWDGETLGPTIAGLEGTAENISILLRSSSDYIAPVTFSGVTIEYSPRRGLRK